MHESNISFCEDLVSDHPPHSRGGVHLARSVLGLSVLYYLLSVGSFILWHVRCNYPRIRKRKLGVILVSSLSWIYPWMILRSRSVEDGFEEFSCLQLFVIVVYFPVITFVPYCIRALLFFFTIKKSYILANEKYCERVEKAAEMNIDQANAVVKRPLSEAAPGLQFSKQFKLYHHLSSMSFAYIVLLVFSCLSTIFALIILLPQTDLTMAQLSQCHGCGLTHEWSIYIAVYGSASITVCLYIFFVTRNEPDTFEIRKEIVIATIGWCLFYSAFLIFENMPWSTFIRNIEFDWFYLAVTGWLFIHTVTYTYQMLMAKREASDRHKSIQMHASTFEGVMKSAVGRQLFKIHLIEELSLENYLFCLEISAWRKDNLKCLEDVTEEQWGVSRILRCFSTASSISINEEDPESICLSPFSRLHTPKEFRNEYLIEHGHLACGRSKAMVIYKNYIQPGAILEINIGHTIRESIHQQLHAETPLHLNMFNQALKEVYMLLVSDTFPRFRQSDAYRQFISMSSYSMPRNNNTGLSL